MHRLFVYLLLCIANTAHATVMHLIILADTSSHTGEYALIELNHVKHEFIKLSDLTHMELNLQIFDGHDHRENVWRAVEDLQIANDDCVVFYYIGHGYRKSTKTTPWPLLYFSREQVNLDLQFVIDNIISKKPRFGLIVADCCNNIMDGLITFNYLPLFYCRRDPALGYRELFEKSSGIVIVAASKPGNYAYCDENGHFYSQAFWRCLQREVLLEKPSWRRLLDQTAAALRSVQTPYDEILTYP